jgi:hypothetical protein
MVALDSAARAPSQIRFNLSAVLIGGGLAGAVCAAAGPLAFLGFAYEGWSLADRATDEFAGLLFLVPFLAGAAATLFPNRLKGFAAIDARSLSLGFVAAYAIHLIVAVLSATADTGRLGVNAAAAFGFQLLILSVMAATSGAWFAGLMDRRFCRRLHSIAVWFFWLAYTFAYIGHFDGPHVPDASYGVGLMALIAALMVRFAAALKAAWVRPVAEKVG